MVRWRIILKENSALGVRPSVNRERIEGLTDDAAVAVARKVWAGRGNLDATAFFTKTNDVVVDLALFCSMLRELEVRSATEKLLDFCGGLGHQEVAHSLLAI